jgi:hypothetical protein
MISTVNPTSIVKVDSKVDVLLGGWVTAERRILRDFCFVEPNCAPMPQ